MLVKPPRVYLQDISTQITDLAAKVERISLPSADPAGQFGGGRERAAMLDVDKVLEALGGITSRQQLQQMCASGLLAPEAAQKMVGNVLDLCLSARAEQQYPAAQSSHAPLPSLALQQQTYPASAAQPTAYAAPPLGSMPAGPPHPAMGACAVALPVHAPGLLPPHSESPQLPAGSGFVGPLGGKQMEQPQKVARVTCPLEKGVGADGLLRCSWTGTTSAVYSCVHSACAHLRRSERE